jgi:hypothetical protein
VGMEGFDVSNSIAFIQKVKDIVLQDDEILMSFDVVSLFPCIPINLALQYMNKWLITRRIDAHKISCYVNVMKQCMEDNFFKFRNQIFWRKCMGSCLSPLIANNVYMRTLETNLKSSPLFPRIWLRYVDDIFAVTKREKVNETMTWLNSQHPKIQFTFEIEEDRRIPFLDVMVERYIDRLVFDVYRKPTST